MEKVAYYCQKCRAANESGEVNCWRCGTRLMLVVFPPSIRREEGIAPSYYEDHLLERVSLLELRLAQVTEQLAMAYEFIQRETKEFQRDHALLQSFFETLEKVNPELSEVLSRECLDAFSVKKDDLAAENQQELYLKKILAEHNNEQAELFKHLVAEGIQLLAKDEEKQGFRTLERAVLLSPKNASLRIFIAKQQFSAEKFTAARVNLERAFEVLPQNPDVLLLLGAVYADEGETERSRKLLAVLANNPETSLCVNLIWGVMAAFEASWLEALAALKESLHRNDLPEINYLIGSVYHQIGRPRMAIRYLKKAVSGDVRFADAWYMLSLIYQASGKSQKAEQTRRAAFEAREAGSQSMKIITRNDGSGLARALPFLHFDHELKRLLTGGSLRLNKFFRSQIYEALS